MCSGFTTHLGALLRDILATPTSFTEDKDKDLFANVKEKHVRTLLSCEFLLRVVLWCGVVWC